MRYLLSTAVAVNMLFSNVWLAHAMPAASAPVLHEQQDECSKAHASVPKANFSCLNHCLTQASDQATGHMPLQGVGPSVALLPAFLPQTILLAEDNLSLAEIPHPSLSPPYSRSVVLRQ